MQLAGGTRSRENSGSKIGPGEAHGRAYPCGVNSLPPFSLISRTHPYACCSGRARPRAGGEGKSQVKLRAAYLRGRPSDPSRSSALGPEAGGNFTAAGTAQRPPPPPRSFSVLSPLAWNDYLLPESKACRQETGRRRLLPGDVNVWEPGCPPRIGCPPGWFQRGGRQLTFT